MFVDINSLLPKFSKRFGLSGKIGEEAVKTAYKEVVEEIFRNQDVSRVQAVFFKDRILTVASLSSDFCGILAQKEREIVDKMNKKLGGREVEKIRYLA